MPPAPAPPTLEEPTVARPPVPEALAVPPPPPDVLVDAPPTPETPHAAKATASGRTTKRRRSWAMRLSDQRQHLSSEISESTADLAQNQRAPCPRRGGTARTHLRGKPRCHRTSRRGTTFPAARSDSYTPARDRRWRRRAADTGAAARRTESKARSPVPRCRSRRGKRLQSPCQSCNYTRWRCRSRGSRDREAGTGICRRRGRDGIGPKHRRPGCNRSDLDSQQTWSRRTRQSRPTCSRSCSRLPSSWWSPPRLRSPRHPRWKSRSSPHRQCRQRSPSHRRCR